MTAAGFEVQAQVAYGDFGLDIHHTFTPGKVTGLFGHSGSGKTTLLRVLAGLERQARGRIEGAGEVWLDTEQSTYVATHERGVGYVFQDLRLFDHLSVAGNLRYAERRSRDIGSSPDFGDVEIGRAHV